MRKVVASEFVSLDGVMEDPSWTFQFSSEEQQKFKFDELAASDALLLGRVTYEGFAAAWPNMMEQYEGPRREALGEYTDMMNGYPKHLFEDGEDGRILELVDSKTFGTGVVSLAYRLERS